MKRALPSNRRLFITTLLAIAIFPAPAATIDAQSSAPGSKSDVVQEERAGRVMSDMRTLARALKIVRPGAPGEDPARLIEEPVFRHNGLSRLYEDGTTWVWGARGRPIAFCKLFTFDADEGFWHYCNTLTSTDLIEMYRGDERVSYPQSAGTAFTPIPGAPAPSEKATFRLRQMKELARRFSAHEVTYPPFTAEKTRHELQLKPQPVHRYEDPDHGIVDGAVFLIAHEAEPELILLIEAVQQNGAESWQFGAA